MPGDPNRCQAVLPLGMARTRYDGPLRDETLSVELHNTIYASAGAGVDGLIDDESARAWLDAVGDRLPRAGRGPNPAAAQLQVLRSAVRAAFASVLSDEYPDRATLDILNAHSSLAPHAAHAVWRRGALATRRTHFGNASHSAVVLATIAADTVDLLTGPRRLDLRRCGAPGCVLVFVKDHPRREWCSPACGNRARQARHYRRHKASARGG